MSPETPKTVHTIADYGGLLSELTGEGFEFLVIGGCAVGAYAHFQGIESFSDDLDLFSTRETLNEILEWAPRHGITVEKRPQPRAIPVAVLTWKGLEVNILTSSDGLPPLKDAIRLARAFQLKEQGGLEVLCADPFDLLENKLRVNRPKDHPHIEILKSFVEEEIVAAFETETSPRERLAPARRWLDVMKSRTLPERLVSRLIPLAKAPPDFRFLVNVAPTKEQAQAVLERARVTPGLASELEGILGRREF